MRRSVASLQTTTKKQENTHIFQLEDNTLQARGQRQKHTHLLHTHQNKHDDNHDYEQEPVNGARSVPDEKHFHSPTPEPK